MKSKINGLTIGNRIYNEGDIIHDMPSHVHPLYVEPNTEPTNDEEAAEHTVYRIRHDVFVGKLSVDQGDIEIAKVANHLAELKALEDATKPEEAPAPAVDQPKGGKK